MTLILSILARVVGGHLVSAFLGRASTGALYTLEHLVVGLGFRYFLGLATAFYFTSARRSMTPSTACSRR